ncbi:hypothetical protein CHY_2700 [Carboxydothermus hydrogenoformans Z-2901]|uniref:Uncharacterized protein n=1 Tax=Carboxydothermus hydrogenoformans (strain ATCC BAA-161 / DSM 6008 / Z-2901) TaxID=246194 RepID=Q3A8Q2_CARHZ|nr:hypothetical protein CHY_2700 [Carboxydothermus hydrogenoformans Z-2901]
MGRVILPRRVAPRKDSFRPLRDERSFLFRGLGQEIRKGKFLNIKSKYFSLKHKF